MSLASVLSPFQVNSNILGLLKGPSYSAFQDNVSCLFFSISKNSWKLSTHNLFTYLDCYGTPPPK